MSLKETVIDFFLLPLQHDWFANFVYIAAPIDFTDVLCCADKISDVVRKYAERLMPHLPDQVCFFLKVLFQVLNFTNDSGNVHTAKFLVNRIEVIKNMGKNA